MVNFEGSSAAYAVVEVRLRNMADAAARRSGPVTWEELAAFLKAFATPTGLSADPEAEDGE